MAAEAAGIDAMLIRSYTKSFDNERTIATTKREQDAQLGMNALACSRNALLRLVSDVLRAPRR